MPDPYELCEPSLNRLNNLTCPYCGRTLKQEDRCKEHVVGRRFVPKGSLHGTWNLILNSCRACNNVKSDLEDDLSAISMWWAGEALTRAGSSAASTLIEEARRKATRCISRQTSKRVAESTETYRGSGKLGSRVSINYTMVGPPSLDKGRAFELALLHLVGFAYLTTYDREQRQGYMWAGDFMPLELAGPADWGNAHQKWFMQTVRAWYPLVVGTVADGHFAIAVRKHPGRDVLSWALEWNKAVRLIGFLGDAGVAADVLTSIPPRPAIPLGAENGVPLFIRPEVPLEAAEDWLFEKYVPSEDSSAP